MKVSISTRASVLLLVLLVLCVYYPAISAPLSSVDDPGIIQYLLNMNGFDLKGIFFPPALGNYYRPVLLLSFIADKYLWGLEPSFMHLENIVLHLLNGLLLYAVARKVALRQGVEAPLLPLLAALLFAVHPINTESVNWIAGRTDLLSTLFLLLSLLLLLIRPGSPAGSLAAAFLMLVACLAKESAIFFLPPALLFPFFLSEREAGTAPPLWGTARRSLAHFLFFCGSAAAYFLMRHAASGHHDVGVTNVITHVTGKQSGGGEKVLYLSLKAAGFYLKKIFQPFPLNFAINHVSDLYLPLGVVLLVIVLWLLTRRTLHSYLLLTAVAVGSSALLVPLVRQTWTPLAERYLYIPSAFFAVGFSFAVYHWKGRVRYQKGIAACAVVAAAVGIYGTASRTLIWQDNLALFQDTMRKSPDFIPAQNEVANALYARGRNEEASAMLLNLKITKELISPQYGWVSKAAASIDRGDLAAARRYLDQALQSPGKFEVMIIQRQLKLYDLEVAAGKTDNVSADRERLRLLLRLNQLTGDPFCQYRLGQVYMRRQQYQLAQAAFANAARRSAGGAYYHQPAVMLAQKMDDAMKVRKQ